MRLSVASASSLLWYARPFQSSCPSPEKRGMTCTCAWNTTWPAGERLFMARLIPSTESASSSAWETMRTVRITLLHALSSISNMSVACTFGITRVCPGFTGLMSRNASVASSSYTIRAGISLATMRQNRHSVIASDYYPPRIAQRWWRRGNLTVHA